MADAILTIVYRTTSIDWAGGYDLQTMNERRDIYIQALRAADGRDYGTLFSVCRIYLSLNITVILTHATRLCG
jgi:hypothetical protein